MGEEEQRGGGGGGVRCGGRLPQDGRVSGGIRKASGKRKKEKVDGGRMRERERFGRRG